MVKTTTAKATISEEDMQEFLQLLRLTGEKTDQLSPEEDRRLQNRCWEWIQNGKPKAVMPKIESKVETILKVYREKKLGKQYIFYRNQDGVQNKEFVHTYEQVKEFQNEKPTGKMIDDTSKVITTKENLTVPYTKDLGEELVEKALKTALEPTFYFVQGRFKVKVDAEQFNTDFDEIMKATMRAVSLKKQ